MGKTDVGNTDSNIKQPEPKTGTTKTTASGDRSPKTSGTGNGSGTVGTGSGNVGTGSGTVGTGSGTTETGTAKTVKTEKASKVSVLSNLPDVNIPEPQPKQKRKYTKKAKEDNTSSFDSKQITAFIIAVSSMVASREGMSHWLISESEAKQIAEPLSNIIAKSEQLKVLGEHADAFALVSACLMIFAPRLIITLQNNKSKKGVNKNVKQSKRTNNNTENISNNSPSNQKAQSTANANGFNQSILGEIPSII